MGVKEGFLEVVRLGPEDFIGTASWGVCRKRSIEEEGVSLHIKSIFKSQPI